MNQLRKLWVVGALWGAMGCSSATPPAADAGADAAAGDATPVDGGPVDAPRPADGGLDSVPLQSTVTLAGLSGEAQVLYTEGGVPHVYARNEDDLYRVLGFVVARDRYFMMDLGRRLALGTISGLFGDAALGTDLESRGTGMRHVTEQLVASLDARFAQRLDAYAAGINAYVAAVRANQAFAPSEYQLAAPLLGRSNAGALMETFDRRDVAAMLTTFLYQSGFETDDVGRTAALARLPGDFSGQALAALRQAGVLPDIWNRLAQPALSSSSRAGFGLETAMTANRLGPMGDRGSVLPPPLETGPERLGPGHALRVPAQTLDTLRSTLDRIENRLLRSEDEGFGSNAWAVMGRHTRDGSALLAGDGHLPLTIPTLFYQVGLDTALLGGGDVHQVGIMLPLAPALAMGTNGRVAWSFTQLGGDITDWYREEVLLDANGLPRATRFMGQERPLTRVDEQYAVANVPALMSVGRTETVTRWVTFDGRFLTAIEGRRPAANEPLQPGESRVKMLGQEIVPGDTDRDGVVTAVSFDYVLFSPAPFMRAFDGFAKANNVNEFREASRALGGLSLNQIAADAQGSVYYSGYQSVPCRGYLPRAEDRSWVRGADPRLLLDGTRYGGFHIPYRDGAIDHAPGAADPYQCAIRLEQTPAALDPARGYVMTANNEPGPITADNSVTNDPLYIGGPWGDGFRGARIDTLLTAGVAARTLDEEAMATLQADSHSNLGEVFVPVLLAAIERAKQASRGSPAEGSVEARLALAYTAHQADYDEVAGRLTAWAASGYQTDSGVETFYHTLREGEGARSVATTVYNTWVGRFVRGVFDDERLPEGVFDDGNTSRIRTLRLMLDARGENRTMLGSYNPATRESAYFDVLGTSVIETSDEVALTALDAAITYLRSAPTGPGQGGYGTREWDAFRWGLRHHVRFDSIVSSFLGGDNPLGAITNQFSITPARLALAPNLSGDDPRRTLPGFPRPGDQWGVDAANSGLGGERFTFGSGPTYRMVFALRPSGPAATTGRNVIPGGQSGLRTSPNFDDQVQLWLGNRALPVQFTARAVIDAAQRREVFRAP